MFTPHSVERADCYAEYQARRARQRRIESIVTAVLLLGCAAIVLGLIFWAF